MRITILQLTIASLKQWPGNVFFSICTYMNIYQQEMALGVIPRLVGTQCKQDEENHGEDYALWHLATFGLTRCPGTGCCCEVMMFKHMPTPKKSFSSPEDVASIATTQLPPSVACQTPRTETPQ